jgi:hypothetical protein
VTAYTNTTHGLTCDCCLTKTPPIHSTEASARRWAYDIGWQAADIYGRRGDVCARCAPPEHDRTGCRGHRP